MKEDKGEEEVKSQIEYTEEELKIANPEEIRLWSRPPVLTRAPSPDPQGSSSEERGRSKSVGEDLGGSSSAEPEWGHETGPLVTNPNFARTPWRRFEWGNETDAQGQEPEPTSWGRSRQRSSSSSSSSRSHSPDQLDKEDDESGDEESDEDESSNEGGKRNEPPRDDDDSYDSESDDGTIGQIFKEISEG